MYGGSLIQATATEPKEVNQDLYQTYINLLEKTPLKAEYNKYIRSHLPDVSTLVDIYLSDSKLPSEEHRLKVNEVISKGVQIIKKYGGI